MPRFPRHLSTSRGTKDRESKTYGLAEHLDHRFSLFSHLSNISGVSFLFLFFFCSLFSHFSESFSTLVPLLACAVEIATHASFVFWHAKNAITRSPFGVLHTAHSIGKDLTQ